MSAFLAFFQGIFNLGATLMVPAIMLILGLVFGMGLKSSLRAALLTGIGFVGIYLILDFFLSSVAEVGSAPQPTLWWRDHILRYWLECICCHWLGFQIGMIFIPIGIPVEPGFIGFRVDQGIKCEHLGLLGIDHCGCHRSNVNR